MMKSWQPSRVLISNQEVEDALFIANYNGWYLCPSPINAAFVVMVAIQKVIDENTSD